MDAHLAVWGSLAACVVAAGLAPSAMADVIWDQGWDGVDRGFDAVASQDFVSYDAYDAQILMDFSVSDSWYLDGATSFGQLTQTSSTGASAAVVAQIWDDLPLNGGVPIITSVSGSETIGGIDFPGAVALEADFGGQVLAPGDYYFSIFVVRDFVADGLIRLELTTNGNGTPDWLYSPGGGFGFPSVQTPIHDVVPGPPEANFVLTGTLIPGPGTGLIALLGVPLISRRARR